MLVCIFSSGEGSLRFLSSTAKEMKGKIKGDLRITAVTTQQLQPVAEESTDYVAKDLVALIEWAEREFNHRISV
jgi:hypothetical protein